MRTIAVVLVSLLIGSGVYAGEFMDTFTYADGTFPPEWTWTGDPRGGGVFLVQDEEFTHIEGGHVHFFRSLGIVVEGGEYEFDVKDSYWVFAWRITPDNPDEGRCLCLYHNDFWGQWGYSLAEFSWSTLGGYPDGQYMWHNGGNVRIVHSWTAEPLSGWHHVLIGDGNSHADVFVDGEQIFSEDYEPIADGFIGLGADTGSGVMTPAFDNVGLTTQATPTEPMTWSAVKALFR